MAKTVLKPINLKMLINRKTRCKFSFSPRVMENPDIEFIQPKNESEAAVVKAVQEIHYEMEKVKTTLARATKFRDIRWVDELKVELAVLQEKLNNEIYPEAQREYVRTAEDLRKDDENQTNIQVNLDAGQIAQAISDADVKDTDTTTEAITTAEKAVLAEVVNDDDEVLDMELED